MKLAIFPGSFDPFTNGHLEIVKDGLKVFDKIIIGIGINSEKNGFFTHEQRIEMIKEVVPKGTCEVKAFTGLVAEFAKKEGAAALLRGLRTESDFSYEMPMAMTNRILAPEVSTIFVPTSQKSHYLSSSLVREVASHKGDVSSFVPKPILNHIREKMKTL